MDDDNLAIYRASLPPPLTAEEERVLLSMGEAGRTELIERSLRLVVWLARQYHGRGVDVDDLVQIGNLCVMDAVGKCPHDWQGRLSTWLIICLRRAMVRAIIDYAPMVHVPFHGQAKLRELRSRREEDLTAVERAEERVLRRAMIRPVDIEQPIVRRGRPMLPADYLPDPDESIEDQVCDAEEAHSIRAAVAALPPRWRLVMTRRYWHHDRVTDIAAAMGLSRETVRHYETKARAQLRDVAAMYGYH